MRRGSAARGLLRRASMGHRLSAPSLLRRNLTARYPALLGSLLIGAWGTFWLGFWGSGRYEQQASVIWSTVARLSQLRLTLTGVTETPSGLVYEISTRLNEQPAEIRTILRSEAGQKIMLQLPAALGNEPHAVLDVRVAARDNRGCIRYGGAALLVTDAASARSHELAMHVNMKPLPAALCL